jgi:hypothetical protein
MQDETNDNLVDPNSFDNVKDLCIEPPFMMAFAAPKKSGKTYQIMKILEHCYRDTFDHIFIFCITLDIKDEYKEVNADTFPNTVIHKIYKDISKVAKDVVEEQINAIKLHNKHPEDYDKVQSLFVFDDCVDSHVMQQGSRENIMDMLAMRGRHMELSTMYVTQALPAVSMNTRKNTDALFIFSPINMRETESILEQYVPKEYRADFLSKSRNVFKKRYSFILIDSTGERRTDFKKRIRVGYSQLLFNTEPGDKDFEMRNIKQKRKYKTNVDEIQEEHF